MRMDQVRPIYLSQNPGENWTPSKGECSVVILGHNLLFDTLLKDYIESHSSMKVFIHGHAADPRSAVSVLDEDVGDIVKLINACGKTWTELSSMLEKQSGIYQRASRAVLFTVDPLSDIQSKALQWGVRGLIYSTTPPEMLIKAIECVVRGELWAPRKQLERCILDTASVSSLQHLRRAAKGILSEREAAVLSLVANGHTNRTIGEKLYISEHTVKKHISNIFRRIGVTNRFQATLWVAQRLS